jgi:hypothetical protein
VREDRHPHLGRAQVDQLAPFGLELVDEGRALGLDLVRGLADVGRLSVFDDVLGSPNPEPKRREVQTFATGAELEAVAAELSRTLAPRASSTGRRTRFGTRSPRSRSRPASRSSSSPASWERALSRSTAPTGTCFLTRLIERGRRWMRTLLRRLRSLQMSPFPSGSLLHHPFVTEERSRIDMDGIEPARELAQFQRSRMKEAADRLIQDLEAVYRWPPGDMIRL